MDEQAKCYGEYPVIYYQTILGLCAFISSGALFAVTMAFPPGDAGGLQMLYICGLYAMVVLYRIAPLLTVIYGILPLLYPILGRWIAFPFFFRGIDVSLFGERWIFALTAIVGYIFYLIDRRDASRLAKEDELDMEKNAESNEVITKASTLKVRSTMKKLWIAVAALALAALPALGAEATFERSLSVSGRVELSVATGSGNIHITHGSGNQVHIYGRVKSGWGGSEERVKEIAAHPPIEQTGNIVRIGGHSENMHNISIDYEILAPENSFLDAGSGSGDISIDGVGENSKLHTGSGNIHAVGLHGGFSADTGSGNVYAEQTGTGDVKAQTGSGNVELHNLHGGVHAGTGSGNLKLAGTPSSDWKLWTGSGNIEYSTGGAAFNLEASTGSGNIHTDMEMLTQGTQDHHHVSGKIRGGGPTVRISTGSGDIRLR
jgi:DUF4097 and DUF4098 domain-containing protein YvlB